MGEEIIEENVLAGAISETEGRLIAFLTIFLGVLLALCLGKLTPEQFLLLLSVDGLIYKVLEKNV